MATKPDGTTVALPANPDGSFDVIPATVSAKKGLAVVDAGKSTTDSSSGIGAVFSIVYKIVMMIVLALLVIIEYVQMAVLLIMSTIISILLGLSPTTKFLNDIAVPLWNVFANLANLMMGFLFIFTGAQAMMGAIKSQEAISRLIQLSIYTIVSNFTYLVLAFVIGFADGFARILIAVFAGGDLLKLFWSLLAQFGGISEVRNTNSLFPATDKITSGISAGFSDAGVGVFTNLVLKESIIVIMLFVVIIIFKDTFILVVTRTTVLLLYLITSPLLALAYLVKDMMPSAIKSQLDPLISKLFVTISFNLTFIIAILLTFTITNQANEGIKKILPATTDIAKSAKKVASMVDFGGITANAQADGGVESAVNSLVNTTAALIPVFLGLAVLFLVNDFYKNNFFKEAHTFASGVMGAASKGLQNFRESESFGQGMAMMSKDIYKGGTALATGTLPGQANLLGDIGGAALSGVSKTAKEAVKLRSNVTSAANSARAGVANANVKLQGSEAVKLRNQADKNYQNKMDSDPTVKAEDWTKRQDVDNKTNAVARDKKVLDRAKIDLTTYAQANGFMDSNGNVVSDQYLDSTARDMKNRLQSVQTTYDQSELERQTLEADYKTFKENNSGTTLRGERVVDVAERYETKSNINKDKLETLRNSNQIEEDKRKQVDKTFKEARVLKYVTDASKISSDLNRAATGGDDFKSRKADAIKSVKAQMELYKEAKKKGKNPDDSTSIEIKLLELEAQLKNLQNTKE